MRTSSKNHHSRKFWTRKKSSSNFTKARKLLFESCEPRRLLTTTSVQVTIENLSDSGGLAGTPFWIGFHDGGFETARSGQPASNFPGVEELAETGDTSVLSSRFAATNASFFDMTLDAPAGFAGAPVFEAGESVSTFLDVTDAETNRYLSFASMVIPSNDAFIANFNPTAYEIFDGVGGLLGTRTIEIYGTDVWDAGTEVNDPALGAAFTTLGGDSQDENGVIGFHPGLSDFVGIGLPTGNDLEAAFIGQTPIARITITDASFPVGPVDAAGPVASAGVSDVIANVGSHSVAVTYSDPSGIDVSSIDTSDLWIQDSQGRFLAVSEVATDASVPFPRNVTATYSLTSNGDLGFEDNGTYRINLNANVVRDQNGIFNAESVLTTFQVNAGVELDVTIENLAPNGGLGQSPFWVGLHNGSFDIGTRGEDAALFAGLEELAEGGDVGPLSSRFQAEVSGGPDLTITSPAGFAGAPVFEAGETVTQSLTVNDPALHRYFSFASMIIPSNDAFIANLNERAYQLFDASGNFLGPTTITVYGRNIYDSGTEVNDPFGGAAFSTEGGNSADENGVIRLHDGLDAFISTGLPTGQSLQSAFGAATPIARITIGITGSGEPPADESSPEISIESAAVTTSGASQHTLTATFSDASGIDLATIDAADLRVEGPNGSFLQVTGASFAPSSESPVRTQAVTYTIESPDGQFDPTDNGIYRVYVSNAAVSDLVGNANTDQLIGELVVDVGTQLDIKIESLADIGGLGQTPFWVGFHDGRFDLATLGESASAFGGIEELAEGGDVSGVSARFGSEIPEGSEAILTAPDGFVGAPVFEPGEVVTQTITVDAAEQNRFFSFASMIIPSNDAFLANLSPTAYELFDANGTFQGTRTIVLYGSDIWDAGTEVNSPTGGAAFSTEGGTSVDENGVIHAHMGLDDFVATGLPTGEDLSRAFDALTPVARITISSAGSNSLAVDDVHPRAEVVAAEVTAPGANEHAIQVTYTDPSGVDLSSISAADLRIDGTSGRFLRVTNVQTDTQETGARTVMATYTVVTPEGGFESADNGIYRIYLRNGAVADSTGNSNTDVLIGELEVNVGVRLQFTAENLAPDGGLFQTPFWIGVHDGSFDLGTVGQAAADFGGLEELSEEGVITPLSERFALESSGVDGVIAAPDGFAGAPVFEPGESASQNLVIDSPASNRFFSYASMIIPSNDAFVANLDSRAIELFDPRGEFLGPRTIEIFGRNIYDAGTEVNDTDGGAAFATAGGTPTDENGVIAMHDGLDAFVGQELATGENLQQAFLPNTPIARITVCLDDGSGNGCTHAPLSNGGDSGFDPLDVNRDGAVTPLDALLVVNFLNNQSGSGEAEVPFNLDVEGNGRVEPLDALMIINGINEKEDRMSHGEAMQTAAVDAVMLELDEV